jgi:hypothetical protein
VAVALAVEQAGEQEPELGQLDRAGGVAEPLLEAALDQQLTGGEGLQPAVQAQEDGPILARPGEEAGDQLRGLLPLGRGLGEPGLEGGEEAVPGGVLLGDLRSGGHGLSRTGGLEQAQEQGVHLPLAQGAPRAQVILDPALLGSGGFAAREALQRFAVRVLRDHPPSSIGHYPPRRCEIASTFKLLLGRKK